MLPRVNVMLRLEDTEVGNKPREKMPLSKRAKQFMPFAALSGLDDALRQKEWEVEARQKAKDMLK